MKEIFRDVPARVMRLRRLVNWMVVMAFFAIALAPSAGSGLAPVAQCIPMNDRFVGPLKPLTKEIIGGIGGLIPLILTVLIVVTIVWGMIKVFRNEDLSNVFKAIVAIPAVVILGIAVLIMVNAAIVVFNDLCTTPTI